MNWQAIDHGTTALVFAYAVTGTPMLIGLIYQRARFQRILTAPLMAVPVTVAALAAWYFVCHFWEKSGVLPHGDLKYWILSLFLAAIGFIAGILLGGKRANATHERGTLIEEGRRTRVKRGELSIAGISIPLMDETKHFKLIGTTGTGKSTAIREILSGALARGDRVIIADPDAGYLNRFYDSKAGDTILNPFDNRSSRWDPFAEIDQPYDVEQLARALIPDHDDADKTWRNYARTFLTAVIRQQWELGARDPAMRNLRELYRLVSMAPGRGTEDPGREHPRTTLPGIRQRAHVRLAPFRRQRPPRSARAHARAREYEPVDPPVGEGRPGSCTISALHREPDQRAALHNLRLDAPRHLRGDERPGA